MPRKLIAELILDPSQYIKGLRKATRASDEFVATQKRTLGQVGRGVGSRTGALGAIGGGFLGGGTAVGAGILAGEITQGLEASINAASDLNEQMSKTNVVFGQSSKAVEDWSQTTSTAFGISQREALKTASSFGALFAPVGFVGRQAADQSEKLTQLGADLASFYNTDVQQALDAIRSGLVGEERPLRDYGVRLSAARVQQEALVETGKKHAKQLTDLDKTMARIKIIFQDTKNAQGDYARTSEGLANQTRTLKANLDDLSTSLGSTLVPAMTKATGAANDFFKGLRGQGGGTASDVGKGAEQGKNLFERVNNWMPGFLKAQNVFKFAVTRLGPQGAPILFWQLVGKVFGDEPKKAVKNIIDPETAMKMRHGIALSQAIAADAADAARTMKPATAQQRNTWFDQMIGRLQLRAGLLTDAGAQIAAYQKIADLLRKQIAKINDATRQLNLKDQALQVAAQIAALVQQRQQQAIENMIGGADIPLLQADLTKTLTDNLAALELQRQLILKAIQKYGDTKDLQLKLIQNQIDIQGTRDQQRQQAKDAADQARQEKVGWLEFAFERAQATKTVADDLKRANALLSYWQKQAATGKRTLEEAQQVWHWQQEIANLRKKGSDLFTKFTPVEPNKFVQSLGLTGLTPAQIRTIGAAAAGIGRGGTVPGGHTAAFAGAGVVVHGDMVLNGVNDPAGLSDALTKYGKTRPSPRRGAR